MEIDKIDQFCTDPSKATDLAFLYDLASEYPDSELVQHAIVMAQKAVAGPTED